MANLLESVISMEGEKLKAGEKHNGRRLKPKDHPAHDELLQSVADLQPNDPFKTRTTVVGYAYPPSTAPLANLERTLLAQLRLGVHRLGDFIAFRTTSEDHQDIATTMVVEDGSVPAIVRLYQQDAQIEPSVHFQKGSCLIIKEPYFQMTDARSYVVRVDHVSDLVPLFDTNDDRIYLQWRNSVEEHQKIAVWWKMQGNGAYQEKNFFGAVKKYVM